MEYPAAAKALRSAKIQLMRTPDCAFFSTICFSLKQLITEAVSTAATDGDFIYYNPNFLTGLDVDERVFLIVHEAMHVALLHLIRRGDRNPKKWNMAADYVINLMLVKRGFKMPEGGLLDYQYDGMDVVAVYNKLEDDPSSKCPMDDILAPGEGPASQGNGDSQSKQSPGTPEQVQARIEAGMQEHEDKIKEILIRAAIQSKMMGDTPGTIPGDIQIFLDNMLDPKLPWEQLLRRYMNQLAKTDYSWKRPNRRFLPNHYLPTLQGEKVGHIMVAIDTSGSVTQDDFVQFVSEVGSILKKLKPEKITLIQFDTAIKSIDVVKNLNDLSKVKFTGRGGTILTEVIDWVIKHKPLVSVIITDGFFYPVDRKKVPPILWTIYDNPKFTTNYGKVIHFSSKS